MLVATALVFLALGLPPVQSMQTMLHGATDGWQGWSRTLVKAAPLAFVGLGMVVAWKAGMFNIGGEGQYVMGAIGAAVVAKSAPYFPNQALPAVFLLAGAATGAAYAALPAWLSVKRGVQVVISTILLNFIALHTLAWLVRGPLQESKHQVPMSDTLPRESMLMRPDPAADFHLGIPLVLVLGVGVWILLYRTKFGIDLRTVGAAPSAARANGVRVGRTQIAAMALSGALCGLAGANDYAGLTGRLADGFAQNWGFLAIPVALLGGLTPQGTLAASVLFGAMFAGSETLRSTSSIGNEVIPLVQSVVVAAYIAASELIMRRAARKEAR